MSKALIVFGELFCFVWKVIEGVFHCSVIYVGQEYTTKFMVTPCINNIQHFIFQVMHTTLKKSLEILKHFKIRKLLQHVSVYKETIIREPQPVLS